MLYSELTTYCPLRDCEVTRLSTVNARGHEFFAIIPRANAKAWRKIRQTVIEALAQVIADGQEPGEYNIQLEH